MNQQKIYITLSKSVNFFSLKYHSLEELVFSFICWLCCGCAAYGVFLTSIYHGLCLLLCFLDKLCNMDFDMLIWILFLLDDSIEGDVHICQAPTVIVYEEVELSESIGEVIFDLTTCHAVQEIPIVREICATLHIKVRICQFNINTHSVRIDYNHITRNVVYQSADM